MKFEVGGAALAALILMAPPASAEAMFRSSSPVIQLDGKNFKQKVLNSNTATMVEFYAPWCGHCQNLKPAYEDAAKNLKGLANIAAINCDDDKNKAMCGEYGVQGFPTLKSFKPSKKKGKPIVEEYQGPRTARGIRDWIVERIPNNVVKLDSKSGFDNFLSKDNSTAKAILFTKKGVTSPLYKSVANDFLGAIPCAQVRDNQKDAVKEFGVENYPTLVLLPGGEKEALVYDGEMKKDQIVKFLSQVAKPKTDDEEVKDEKKKTKTKPQEAEKPKPSFDPKVPDLPSLEKLSSTCLSSKSKTCILAITPPVAPPLAALEEAHAYFSGERASNFPFYQLPLSVLSVDLRKALEIPENEETAGEEKTGSITIRAINGKKGWYKKFDGDAENAGALRNWLDDLRMGEGKKNKLPGNVLPKEEDKEKTKDEKKTKETADEEPHDEL